MVKKFGYQAAMIIVDDGPAQQLAGCSERDVGDRRLQFLYSQLSFALNIAARILNESYGISLRLLRQRGA